MNKFNIIVTGILIFLLSGALFPIDSSTVKKGDLAIKIQKLTDKVMVLTEESPYENNTVAISSKRMINVVPKIGPTLVPRPPTINMPNMITESFKPIVSELRWRKL